ncbi:hypothetical protein BKA58DRAFT_7616 [Alternaria rosae]|uniref:uncharacterized protein n=1 Tax=Alternaria rosae TaxID=1187941 RepID=UPI001E8D43A1|nr:uncharacterized protein BKA58DRAFT_7616 [Alternaria rosae]KAH6881758.1 hypothetical protein BKA58DRAFT_7616 [Alternaria rosae]
MRRVVLLASKYYHVNLKVRLGLGKRSAFLMPPLTYAAQLPGLPPDCLPSLPTYLSCHQSPGVSKTCLDPMAAASRITAERLNSASQATPARSIANSSPPHLLSPLGSPNLKNLLDLLPWSNAIKVFSREFGHAFVPSLRQLLVANSTITASYTTISAHSFTYDHRILRSRLPVRSALVKQDIGGLVVRWVTTGESPLLYVFAFLLRC